MDYKFENDNELLFLIAEKDEDAEKVLIEKYKHVIKSIANNYLTIAKNIGMDENDLYQEGLLGFINAINSFSNEKNVTFYTFSSKCIEYKIRDAIRQSGRKKYSSLNTALSLDLYSEEEKELYKLISDDSKDPSKQLIELEDKKDLLNNINKNLTKFEQEVLKFKLEGYTNEEIAQILKKEKRSIENSITRIKQKYKEIRKK